MHDQPAAARGRAAQLARGGGGVVGEQALEPLDLLLLPGVAADLGGADLVGDGLGLGAGAPAELERVIPAAVEPRAPARRGGLIVIEPLVGQLLEFLGVLAGEDEGLGAEAVRPGVGGGPSLGLSRKRVLTGGSRWTIPRRTCAIVGVSPGSAPRECPAMPTIPQRSASAFTTLFGRYGDITRMARDREQSRHSLYREADQVLDAVDGSRAQAQIAALQPRIAEQQAPIPCLPERLERAVAITPDKQGEFASVAPAEGVSLRVARRLWRVVAGSRSIPSGPALGRVTPAAGPRAGPWRAVLDEAVRPRVEPAAAEEIFGGERRP